MRRMRSGYSLFKTLSEAKTFIQRRGTVIALLCFVIGGIGLGVWIFGILNTEHKAFVSDLLYKPIETVTSSNIGIQVVSSCLRHLFLPILLFLFGLTAFGCPVILCTLILFGFRIGIVLSTSYVAYGGWHTAVIVYIPLFLVGISTVLAARRALRMSYIYSCQLLPFGANCGGLWSEFKHYLVSYIISFSLIIAASITEVLSQLLSDML